MRATHTIGAACLLLGLLAGGLLGCQETRPDRSYVQANVLDKEVFQGEWYYVRTVVDHDYESSWMGYYGTFTGDQTYSSAVGALERVTWIVDESYLYAYRTYPVVAGADDRENDRDFREDPVAAFRILKHFDIMKSYNPVTGEELNVVDENDTERPWYERRYMRVDWSQNLLLGYYWTSLDAFESSGYVTRESVPFYCGEGSDGGYTVAGSCDDGADNDYDGTCDAKGCKVTYVENGKEAVRDLPPDPACVGNEEGSEVEIAGVCKPEWLPAVRYTGPGFDAAYGTTFSKDLEDEGLPDGTPYYFSFVTQEMWSPSTEWVWMEVGMGSFPLTSVRVSIRNSFLRAPEETSYEKINVVDSLWDRFGIIRLAQEVYHGGEGEGDPADPDEVIKSDRGYTDFRNYWGARHNIWMDYKDDAGNVIPVADRQVRRIVYYLNAGFPKWLVTTAFEVVEEWNRAMMDAVAVARTGQKAESYDCQMSYGAELPQDPGSYADFDGFLQGPSSTPSFTGADCVFVLRVNSNDLPPGEYPDAAGTRVIARGADGAIDPRRSTVDPYGEQMGDLRFKFMSVIDTPGAQFSGVSLPLMDPRTGELIQSNFNITRESVVQEMTGILVELGTAGDICKGDTTDFGAAASMYRDVCNYLASLELPTLSEYIEGDYRREYFAGRGRVDSAVTPVTPQALSGSPSPPDGGIFSSALTKFIDAQAAQGARKIEKLGGSQGRAMLMSDRLMRLKGSSFEKMIYDNPETYAMLSGRQGVPGPIVDPSSPVTEEMLEQISVMRTTFPEQRWAEEKKLTSMLAHHMEPINPFIDYNMIDIAKEFAEKGYGNDQIALRIGQLTFKAVMLHEAGHSLGMEHNFAGSVDYNNYDDRYYPIVNINQCIAKPCGDPADGGNTAEREALNCWPCPSNVSPETPELSVEETYQWSKEVARMERKRDILGVNKYMSSSIMDYLPTVYDDYAGLGKFDRAFAVFAYGGKVEAYAGDPRSKIGTSKNEFVLDPVVGGAPIPKVYWTYYLGGQKCAADSECPYNPDGAMGSQVPDSQRQAGIYQKCVTHPRGASLPKVCSEYYADVQAMLNNAPNTDLPYYPVTYMYCSNNRTNDISWCNMFDEGGSYREIVANWREFYQRYYPSVHFRRFNRNFVGGVLWYPFDTMGKIYQHFYYRYFYEPIFRSVQGPLGIDDMYMSIADSLNFFGENLGTPDVGSYDLDPRTNTYYKVSDAKGKGDLDMDLGMGLYMWSQFQEGQYGIFRMERSGYVWDKIYTLLALSLRDWGTSYTYDERFWFNYYDLFPHEVLEMVGGVILDDPTYYGARWYTDPDSGQKRVLYPDIWAPSECSDAGTNPFTECDPSRTNYYFDRAWEELENMPDPPAKIAGNSNEIVRNYALIMSLAEFPIFFDTTYEQQMFLCEKGSGYCFQICDKDEMTAGTAPYFCAGDEVTPLEKGKDYVEYTSGRLHKTIVAVKVNKLFPAQASQLDIAMNLLRRANGLQDALRAYEAHLTGGTCPSEFPAPCTDALEEAIARTSAQLVESESFITNVINIQREYGISSWLI